MVSFALLAEGETDQVVLEEIIQTVYYEALNEEVDVNWVQPIYDETSRSRNINFGGWESLLNFCNSDERMLQALSVNDYVVIQIDTDICEHVRIGLSRNTLGSQLLQEMKDRILSEIPSEVLDAHREKIIFAIAIHSMECWLLPLHAARDGDKNQILNCEGRLLRALASKGVKYVKDASNYSSFSRDFRRYRALVEAMRHNESLNHFVTSLPVLHSNGDDPQPANG